MHGNDELVVTRETAPHEGQGAATNPPANFRHDLVWLSRARKCETAGPAIYLPGRRRETELPRDWRGSISTASSSLGFGLVSKQCGGAGSSENSAARGRRVQRNLRFQASLAAAQSSKPGSMSPLHAAPLDASS